MNSNCYHFTKLHNHCLNHTSHLQVYGRAWPSQHHRYHCCLHCHSHRHRTSNITNYKLNRHITTIVKILTCNYHAKFNKKRLTPCIILRSFEHVCQSHLRLLDIQENLHHGVLELWASSMKSVQLLPEIDSKRISKCMENNFLVLCKVVHTWLIRKRLLSMAIPYYFSLLLTSVKLLARSLM